MSRDATIFFGGLLFALLFAFTMIDRGISKMVLEEADAKAIARIFKPEGCELATDVPRFMDGQYLIKCGDVFYKIKAK